MADDNSEWATEPIAIIGMSCKFSGGASSPEKLWELMAEGRTGWSEIPEDRFNLRGVYHPNHERNSTTHVKGGHFLDEDVAAFDAAFFNYSAEMAQVVDPQFRLQLESTYEALENAGLPLAQVAGSQTSVFAGVFTHDYQEGIIRDEDQLPRFNVVGTWSPMSANRISHFFDFRGASMTLETGCSTTLVALHQAIQTLRNREADMSVVTGANVMLNPDTFKAIGSLGMLSPDGRSYAFDARANGYGRGEGVATLVVKRLSDALAANDPIRAVIRETALNQDGKTDTITTPSRAAQVELMRQCYRRAGLDPQDTQYFEAHGTGTPTGDPIEAGAMAAIFSEGREEEKKFLRIGSVKTNVGHTEATSGLAAMIKSVLCLEKGLIPPSVNYESPNPKLKMEEWRLKLVREMEQWPETLNDGPRRISTNNFGYGGANAHVILESADSWTSPLPQHAVNGNGNGVQSHETNHDDDACALVLSARDEKSCQQMCSELKAYLDERSSLGRDDLQELLRSLAYTLSERRTPFPWVAAGQLRLEQDGTLDTTALESPRFKPSKRPSKVPRIGMVFTGQGSQWYAMGRELLSSFPVFSDSIDEAEVYLHDLGANWSLLEELQRDAKATKVHSTEISIPVCVALQIALVQLLESWGITPTAVTSHSSGEISAAFAVGALTHRQAMAVAFYRAKLAAEKSQREQGPPKGAMIAVGLGATDAQAYIDSLPEGSGRVVIACINSPQSITMSGDASGVEAVETLCKQDEVFARRLKVQQAYHSHHMDSFAEAYREKLRKDMARDVAVNGKNRARAAERKPHVIFSSAVTGGRMTDMKDIASPDHWVRSLVQPVEFVDALTEMVLGEGDDPTGRSVDVLLEVGPHTALGGPIREILSLPDFEGIELPYWGCLVRDEHAGDAMRSAALNLFRQGLPLNMSQINFPDLLEDDEEPKILTDLPSYPWNHTMRHWQESRINRAIRERHQPPHELLGMRVAGTEPGMAVWRRFLRVAETPWVRDHMVQGSIVYPGSGYICLAIEAASQLEQSDTTSAKRSTGGISGFRLRDVNFLFALVVPDDADGVEIRTTLRLVPQHEVGDLGWQRFEVHSVTKDNRWTLHARGMVMVEKKAVPETSTEERQPLSAYTRHPNVQDLFANLRARGINHGPLFQNTTKITQDGRRPRSVCEIMTRHEASTDTDPNIAAQHTLLHPITLDAIVVAFYSLLPNVGALQEDPKLPRSVESMWVSSNISREVGRILHCDSTLLHDDAQSGSANITVLDGETNAAVLEIESVEFASLGRGSGAAARQNAVNQGGISASTSKWEQEVCSKVVWEPLALEQSGNENAADKGIAVNLNRLGERQRFAIVTSTKKPPPSGFVDLLSESLQSYTTHSPEHLVLGESDADAYKSKVCIFAGEIDEPILADLDEARMDGLRAMVTQCSSLLWITTGATMNIEAPERALSQGLLRVLRNELIDRKFLSLDLDPSHKGQGRVSGSGKAVAAILQVLEQVFGRSENETGPIDFEYAERDGVLMVPRFYKDEQYNDMITGPLAHSWSKSSANKADEERVNEDEDEEASPHDAELPLFHQHDRPLRLEVGIPGHLDTVSFVDDDEQGNHDPLASEIIEINPHAYGIGLRDVQVAMGSTKHRSMCFDCAGIITRVSVEALNKGYNIGDYVMVLSFGTCLANRVRIPWQGVVKIPSGLDFVTAASLPSAFTLAYAALVERTRLEAGQSVLIHAAAEGFGQAAIMLAKHLGVAEIYATVSSPEERSLISREYDISAESIFDSRDDSFVKGIMAATKGNGVDVVLHSLPATFLHASLGVVAPLGHLVEVGKSDTDPNSLVTADAFSRSISWVSLDMATLLLRRRPQVHRMLGEIARLVEEGSIRPIQPITVHPIQDVAAALQLIQTGAQTGQVVLSAGPNERVHLLPRPRGFTPRQQLRHDASYLVIGGVGGIGRSIAHWLVDHGGRNLILMSRSAGGLDLERNQDTEDARFIRELRAANCRVKPVSCDAADASKLMKALRFCEVDGMPPVRGVIQGAMLLRDSLFEQMTLENWQAGLRPKLNGTWNLHSQFSQPDSLDFFVMLSSVSGVLGIASQANYAAGGSYEDAMASWRQARGLPGVSIDLGPISDIGYVSTSTKVADRLRKEGDFAMLDEDIVLRALNAAVLHPLGARSQIIVGLNSSPGPQWDVDGRSQLGRDARFSPLRPAIEASKPANGENGTSLAAQLGSASSQEDAKELVGSAIATKLADIFVTPVAEIEMDKPPAHYGVDSLVAVELRNMLVVQAAADVSIFDILQAGSLAALAGVVAGKSRHVKMHE